MRLRAILSSRYYAKLLSLPQRYFDTQLTGTIISRLQRSITETTQFLQMFSNSFFPMLITVVAVLVIAAGYSWPLALLLLVIYPVFTWPDRVDLEAVAEARAAQEPRVRRRRGQVRRGDRADPGRQELRPGAEELTAFDARYAEGRSA